jgi:hypothetical protein
VTLNNRVFDEISWEVVDRGDTTFSIEVAQPKAKQGESLSIAVTPKENLEAGTYLSSFTVRVTTAADQKPVLLTIPVKIVKY